MAKWDIEPAGVQGVVRRTQAAARGFERVGKHYSSGAKSAAGGSGSPIVSLAVVHFTSHHENTLSHLVKQTMSSLNGAVKATNAYLHGDLEMAANAQRNAGAVGELAPRRP